ALLAIKEAQLAAQTTPPVDEDFRLSLAELFLRAGAIKAAREELRNLPNVSSDPERRATLGAEIALAGGDLEGAKRSLANAADDPHRLFLVGLLNEKRGDFAAAKTAYERASADRSEFVRARVRLTVMNLQPGDRLFASRGLEELLKLTGADTEIVGPL